MFQQSSNFYNKTVNGYIAKDKMQQEELILIELKKSTLKLIQSKIDTIIYIKSLKSLKTFWHAWTLTSNS